MNSNDVLGSFSTADQLDYDPFRRFNGQSVGAELSLDARFADNLRGELAYTLSRTIRFGNSGTTPAPFDRTHVLSALVHWDMGRNWSWGTRLVFYTGVPAATFAGDRFDVRSSPHYRVDVKLQKKWLLGPKSWLAFNFEVLNASLSAETTGVECKNGRCEEQEFGPLTIPSLGLEAAF